MIYPKCNLIELASELTKLEYFAIHSLQGILAAESSEYHHPGMESAVRDAVRAAHLLVAELNK